MQVPRNIWFQSNMPHRRWKSYRDAEEVQINTCDEPQTSKYIIEYIKILEARNQELENYTLTVAHKMKSTLMAITHKVEIVQLLTEQSLPSSVDEQLHKIHQTIEAASLTMDTLLEHTLSTPTNAPHRTIDPYPILQVILNLHETEIDRKGIKVTVQQPLPFVYIDATYLHLIFENLLSNAIKYIGEHNPNPYITIRAYTQAENIRFEVADNGVGLLDDQYDTVFQLGSRVHETLTPGHGVGLHIVKSIVNRLGGSVGATSNHSQGSIFWFNLPTKK